MLNLSFVTSRWRTDWPLFLIALIVLVLDQWSKTWIRTNLAPGQSIPPDGIVRLTHITNTGAAFGLFQEQSILFVVIAAAVITVIFFYQRILPLQGALVRLALGLQLGGALGNLIDRLSQGYVTDFVDLRVWPVFNVADSAIVVGVCTLAYLLLRHEGRDV